MTTVKQTSKELRSCAAVRHGRHHSTCILCLGSARRGAAGVWTASSTLVTHSIWHVFQHQMEEGLILFCCGVEALLELDNVGVVDHLHDLQLAVFEPLVLQHLLDSHLCSRTCIIMSAVARKTTKWTGSKVCTASHC